MRKNKKINIFIKLEFFCFFKIVLNIKRFYSYFKLYIFKIIIKGGDLFIFLVEL